MSVVIVTGGAGGIGLGITQVLAKRGHQVVVADLAGPGTEALESRAEELGLMIVPTDVSKARDVAALVSAAIARHGRIDAVVNNAAVGPTGTVLDTDEATFDAIMAVNVKGPFLLCRAVIPHFRSGGGGAIVNVGSGAGHGKPNMAVYAASKGGLFALSASLAYDHFHENIRVNVVVPGGGGIPTGMALERFPGTAEEYLLLPHAGSVAGRPVTPTDVGAAVAFLIGEDASTISGTVIDVGCMANQGGPLARWPLSKRTS